MWLNGKLKEENKRKCLTRCVTILTYLKLINLIFFNLQSFNHQWVSVEMITHLLNKSKKEKRFQKSKTIMQTPLIQRRKSLQPIKVINLMQDCLLLSIWLEEIMMWIQREKLFIKRFINMASKIIWLKFLKTERRCTLFRWIWRMKSIKRLNCSYDRLKS